MICKGCGSEIKEGNFCSECGIGMKNEETNINDKDNVEIVNIESLESSYQEFDMVAPIVEDSQVNEKSIKRIPWYLSIWFIVLVCIFSLSMLCIPGIVLGIIRIRKYRGPKGEEHSLVQKASIHKLKKHDKEEGKIPWYLSIWFIIVISISTFWIFWIPGIVLSIMRFFQCKAKRISAVVITTILVSPYIWVAFMLISYFKAENQFDTYIENKQYESAKEFIEQEYDEGTSTYVDKYVQWYEAQKMYDEVVYIQVEYCNNKYELIDIPDYRINDLNEYIEKYGSELHTETIDMVQELINSWELAKAAEQVEEAKNDSINDKEKSLNANDSISDKEKSLSARETIDDFLGALTNNDYNSALSYCAPETSAYEEISEMTDDVLIDSFANEFAGESGQAEGIKQNENFQKLVILLSSYKYEGSYSVNNEEKLNETSVIYNVTLSQIVGEKDNIEYMRGDQSGIFYEYCDENADRIEKLYEEGGDIAIYNDFLQEYGEKLIAGYKTSFDQYSSYEDMEYKISLRNIDGIWMIENMMEEIDGDEIAYYDYVEEFSDKDIFTDEIVIDNDWYDTETTAVMAYEKRGFNLVTDFPYNNSKEADKLIKFYQKVLEADKSEFVNIEYGRKSITNGSKQYKPTTKQFEYKYYGGLKDGLPSGQGLVLEYISNYGCFFPSVLGNFKEGQLDGYAITFTNDYFGVYSEGNYKQGVKNGDYIGYGSKIVILDLSIYESEVLDEYDRYIRERVSNGRSNDDIIFLDIPIMPNYISSEGKYKDDEMVKDWTLYYPDGTVKYKGKMKDGVYHGKGILYREDGSVKYKGKFKNGEPNN